jgi:hypothetical protein
MSSHLPRFFALRGSLSARSIAKAVGLTLRARLPSGPPVLVPMTFGREKQLFGLGEQDSWPKTLLFDATLGGRVAAQLTTLFFGIASDIASRRNRNGDFDAAPRACPAMGFREEERPRTAVSMSAKGMIPAEPKSRPRVSNRLLRPSLKTRPRRLSANQPLQQRRPTPLAAGPDPTCWDGSDIAKVQLIRFRFPQL